MTSTEIALWALIFLVGTLGFTLILVLRAHTEQLNEIAKLAKKIETYTKDAKPRQSTIGIHQAPLVKPQIERPKQVGPRHRELKGATQCKTKRVLKGGEFT